MPIAVAEQLVLLRRVDEPRREARRVQQPPEVVARIREVRRLRGGVEARVDAAEDDVEPGREHVGHGAGRLAGDRGSRTTARVAEIARASAPATPLRPRARRGAPRRRAGSARSAPPRLGRVSLGFRDPDAVVAADPAVAAQVALLLVQRPQTLHGGTVGNGPDGTDRLGCVRGQRARGRSTTRSRSTTRGTARATAAAAPRRADEEAWTPEHLLLAGLARCTLTSLLYHAPRGRSRHRGARARGTVTRRETDGRFAFVEIEVEADVSLEPAPDEDAVADLLAKAERDCFVGASLTVTPVYAWQRRQ